jgi:large repetitive protein
LVTGQVTITVNSAPLLVASSLPRQMLRNRPFSGRVVATGGVPPYTFTLISGPLPPGLAPIDLNTGRVSGTPTTLGNYFFSVRVADSSSPVSQLQSNNFSIDVVDPIGRNDTIANATPVADGFYSASISPYIDPPDNAPLVADHDYYKVVALSGSIVHLETQAQRLMTGNPLDTVIEIVDGNGTRQSTCRLPGITAATFASSCIDDDIGGNPYTLDSAIDFKVPGPASTPTTFYVHVFDWNGNARPDMTYSLQVSGAVAPLAVQISALPPAARSRSYSQQLGSVNGSGAITWRLASGTLPPGISLEPAGLLSGTATTDGTFAFTLQASDAATPPQIVTTQESIQVVEP